MLVEMLRHMFNIAYRIIKMRSDVGVCSNEGANLAEPTATTKLQQTTCQPACYV